MEEITSLNAGNHLDRAIAKIFNASERDYSTSEYEANAVLGWLEGDHFMTTDIKPVPKGGFKIDFKGQGTLSFTPRSVKINVKTQAHAICLFAIWVKRKNKELNIKPGLLEQLISED